jgi:small subunit ribosomal protein S6
MANHPAYECMLILKPSLAKEESDKIIDRYAEVVKTLEGDVQKIDRMGKRKIAFDMKKNPEGYYATINFTAPGTAIAELERQMRISDEIIKFQTLRNDPVRAIPVKAKAATSDME